MSKSKYLLFAIVVLGFFIRIFGIDWDKGMYLHPDERFLAMVMDKIAIPNNIFAYLNPNISSLNPYNNNFMFFVYGTLPLTLGKIIAHFIEMDKYANFYYIGRFLTAFFDCLSIIVLYKLALLLERQYKFNPNLKYISAFFYAISVFPIQISHFFTVDIYLSFFMLLTLYLYFKYYYHKDIKYLVFSGIAFGGVLASKVSGIYILLPILLLHFFKKNSRLFNQVFYILIFFITTYLSLRIFDPKSFIDANWFNVQINPIFWENLKQLNAFSDPESYYPPGIQWLNKPAILFATINLAIFGLGIFLFCLSVYGMYQMYRENKFPIKIMIFWVISMFLYQSIQNVKTMRYFIYLYPLFCLFAAYGFLRFKSQFRMWLITLIIIWPILFLNIYLQENSRIQASKWIYENIKDRAIILTEYWDDPLPLPIYSNNKNFEVKQLSVFDKDSEEKVETLDREFNTGDYYILSSNRAYGSIMTVPEKYPYMAKFYDRLLNGQDPRFIKVAEFTNYPGLNLGFYNLNVNDDWAEEAFTVYDHPKVLIYKIL
jgi:hypothetical protein